jgi:hypothetical protein
MVGEDTGRPKAQAVAEHLIGHATNPASIIAINEGFEEAIRDFTMVADIVVCLVDNNRCRLAASKWARSHGVPAVFAMLSADGSRFQCFVQGAMPNDACLLCALPNLDPASRLPCAAAVISSCLLVAAHVVFLTHRTIMGWPDKVAPFNWRESDLFTGVPETVGQVSRRPQCPNCAEHSASTPTP